MAAPPAVRGNSAALALGPGALYVAPIGTTEPLSASAALPSANWTLVGYTEEGSTFECTLTTEGVEVAEVVDTILTIATKRESKISFSMAEVTRRNLALSLNQGAAAANDATVFDAPALGTDIPVMLVHDQENGARWLFRQVKQGGTISIARKKYAAGNKGLLPVTFNCEVPASGLAPWRVFPLADGRV